MSKVALVLLLAVAVNARLIDLSYTHGENEPSMPKFKRFEREEVTAGTNKYNRWSALNNFCTSEHVGTHIDAPYHMKEQGWKINEIPLERMFRKPGVVIDVEKEANMSSDYLLQVKDLERYEDTFGVIPDGAVVLMRTGWGSKTDDMREYMGIDRDNKKHFPGISLDAAAWLVQHGTKHGHKEGVVGVGVETLSLDYGPSLRFEAHVVLLGNNIYGLENLENLEKLPEAGFSISVLPIKFTMGSGAPVRVVADLSDSTGASYTDASAASAASRSCLDRLPQMLLAAALIVFLRQ